MIAKVEPIVLNDIHLHLLNIARDQKRLLVDEALHREVILSELFAIFAVDADLVLGKAALLLLGEELAHLLVVAEPVLSLAPLAS